VATVAFSAFSAFRAFTAFAPPAVARGFAVRVS
jgi:hypothetical protein